MRRECALNCASQAEAPRLEVPSVAAARTRPKLVVWLQSDVLAADGSQLVKHILVLVEILATEVKSPRSAYTLVAGRR